MTKRCVKIYLIQQNLTDYSNHELLTSILSFFFTLVTQYMYKSYTKLHQSINLLTNHSQVEGKS